MTETKRNVRNETRIMIKIVCPNLPSRYLVIIALSVRFVAEKSMKVGAQTPDI
jgi:hypothetical protein